MTSASIFWRLTGLNLRHLLISPVFLVLMPLMLIWLWLTTSMPALPTLNDFFTDSVLKVAGVGAVMFAVTTFPALREVRHSHDLALPLSSALRLLSLTLASVTVTSVIMGSVAALYPLFAPVPPAGVFQPIALVGVILLSWYGPLSAVVSAVWTRSFMPLVAVGLLFPTYLLYTALALVTPADLVMEQMSRFMYLALSPLPFYPDTFETALIYLTHTLLMVLCLTLLVLAARRGARLRRVACLGVVGLSLVGLVGLQAYANDVYVDPERSPSPLPRDLAAEGCVEIGRMTYCPLPGYEPWVEHWSTELTPVVARIPDRAPLPVIWQANPTRRSDTLYTPPDGTAPVGEYWDPENPYHGMDLDSSVVAYSLGLPPYLYHLCSATGQARVVVGSWLVSRGAVHEDASTRFTAAEWFLMDYRPDLPDLSLAYLLTRLPEERVAAVIEEHWETLTSPEADLDTLTELLDLPPADELPEPDWEQAMIEPHELPYEMGEDTPLCP
ncbi:hypothetical protein [Nocardiopsis alba]|uniref:hypothetical protein n=1 Tax=Nocardiopsis alba TaxID=53437 RepID=UPI0036A3120F